MLSEYDKHVKEFLDKYIDDSEMEYINESFDGIGPQTIVNIVKIDIPENDRMRILREIRSYCSKEKIYSYYELKEYARVNNIEWYYVLKHYRKERQLISFYLKDIGNKLRFEGEKIRTQAESMKVVEKSIKEHPEILIL